MICSPDFQNLFFHITCLKKDEPDDKDKFQTDDALSPTESAYLNEHKGF